MNLSGQRVIGCKNMCVIKMVDERNPGRSTRQRKEDDGKPEGKVQKVRVWGGKCCDDKTNDYMV